MFKSGGRTCGQSQNKHSARLIGALSGAQLTFTTFLTILPYPITEVDAHISSVSINSSTLSLSNNYLAAASAAFSVSVKSTIAARANLAQLLSGTPERRRSVADANTSLLCLVGLPSSHSAERKYTVSRVFAVAFAGSFRAARTISASAAAGISKTIIE